MSNIQTYIDEIQNAIYGEEVRSAIVNALNQCYTDATEGMRPEISISTITNGHKVTITVGNQSQNFDVMNGGNTLLKAVQFRSALQTMPANETGRQVKITNIFSQQEYPSDYQFLTVVSCWSEGNFIDAYSTDTRISSDDNGSIVVWCSNYTNEARSAVIAVNVLFWKQVLVEEESETTTPSN